MKNQTEGHQDAHEADRSVADQSPGANSCDDKQAALETADRVFQRVERKVAKGLKPGSDPLEAVIEIGEEMDSAQAAEVREVAGLRKAPGEGQLDSSGPKAH